MEQIPYELYSKIAEYINYSSTAFRFLMLTKEMYHFFNSKHSEAKFRNVNFVLQNQRGLKINFFSQFLLILILILHFLFLS